MKRLQSGCKDCENKKRRTRYQKQKPINGAAEILGLNRDPSSPGHFLINKEELIKVEKILQLFLKFSSKKKVLIEAKRLGLTGKKGRELTKHVLDSIMDNVKWRYRGLWYANKENAEVDPDSLPENKQYQIVELPHGALIQTELLDKVEHKLKDTYEHRKRSGKHNRVYLLSHILEYEDGTKYKGGPGKSGQYYYYYSKALGPNIRCEEIDSAVIERIKGYFKGNDIFKKLVESAVKRRTYELPKIEQKIHKIESELREIESQNNELRERLRDNENRSRSGFMDWLEEEVEKLQACRSQKEQELKEFIKAKLDLVKKSGLETLEETAQTFIERFDYLTPTEKRIFVERMIDKVVIKKDNKLELHVLWESKKGVTRTTKSSSSESSGGMDGDQPLQYLLTLSHLLEITFQKTFSKFKTSPKKYKNKKWHAVLGGK